MSKKSKRRRRNNLIGVGITVLLFMTYVSSQIRPPALDDGNSVSVEVDKAKVTAEVATERESQSTGLAGKPVLTDRTGLLFVFPQAEIPSFWMKGVDYPIDIIWINGDTVTQVTPNIPPAPGLADEALTRYSPLGPVNRVLEVSAGWANRHQVQAGDPIRISH